MIPERGVVERAGVEHRLTPRTCDLLLLLVQSAGETVLTARILEHLWRPGITPRNAVHKAIRELRRAFGDDDARCIETVPRRGYRLAAEVRAEVRHVLALLPIRQLGASEAEGHRATRLAECIRGALNAGGIVEVRLASSEHDASELRLLATLRSTADRVQLSVELLGLGDLGALRTQRLERGAGTLASDTSPANQDAALRAVDGALAADAAVVIENLLDAAFRADMQAQGARNALAFARFRKLQPAPAGSDESEPAQRIEALRAVIALDPDLMPAHVALGNALRAAFWREVDEARREDIVSEIERIAATVNERVPWRAATRAIAEVLRCVNGALAIAERACFSALMDGTASRAHFAEYAGWLAAASRADADSCLALAEELRVDMTHARDRGQGGERTPALSAMADCLHAGDTGAGVEHIRALGEAERLLLAQYIGDLERALPDAVREDPRYGDALDAAGLGAQWRAFLRARLRHLRDARCTADTLPQHEVRR